MSDNHRSIAAFKPHYSFKLLQFVSVNSFDINICVNFYRSNSSRTSVLLS